MMNKMMNQFRTMNPSRMINFSSVMWNDEKNGQQVEKNGMKRKVMG